MAKNDAVLGRSGVRWLTPVSDSRQDIDGSRLVELGGAPKEAGALSLSS